MHRLVVTKNGKKYLVNTPAGCGDDLGPGPGASIGTLWMNTATGSWYSVYISGSSGSAVLAVSQSALPYGDNSIGYQLLATDGNFLTSSLVYLKGNPPAVTIQASGSFILGPTNPKPYLLLQSITDGYFYMAYVHNNAGTPQLLVNQSRISASYVYQSGIY